MILHLIFSVLAAASISFGRVSTVSLKPRTNSPDRGLVTVQSVYQDKLNSQRTITIQGTGFLVRGENQRYFVLTASHVSQGRETQVKLKDVNLPILGRLFDGIGDMEVLEVQGHADLSTDFGFNGQQILWTGEQIGRSRQLDAFNFVLLNSWVNDPNLEIDNREQSADPSSVSCDFNCELLVSETLIQPGASGSPLIMKIPEVTEWPLPTLKTDWREKLTTVSDGSYVVRGLAIRRERFFSRSSFVPASRLSALLNSYLQTHRTPKQPPSQWQVSGPLLYRNFSGIQESEVVAASSGNGVSMDGGNGVSIDAGDLATFGEDQPKKLLSQISPFPKGPAWTTNWWALKSEFRGELYFFMLWFDMEHFAPNAQNTLPVQPPENSKPGQYFMFMEMIRGRFGNPAHGKTFSSEDGRSSVQFQADRVDLKIQARSGEKFTFSLDKNGASCVAEQCAKKFMPVIEVPGDQGHTFIVDLRGFYLLNSSLIVSERFKDPAVPSMTPSQIEALSNQVMMDESMKIKVVYRQQREDTRPMTVREGLAQTAAWASPIAKFRRVH